MSAYITFYMKAKSGEYIPIGDFSRSTEVFRAIEDYVPYGENIPFTFSMLSDVKEEIVASVGRYNEMIETDEAMMHEVAGFNNSIEDKMEEMYHLRNSIAETKEELKYKQEALAWYESLERILWHIEDTKYYSNPKHQYDAGDTLYVGYEAKWPGAEGDEDEDD